MVFLLAPINKRARVSLSFTTLTDVQCCIKEKSNIEFVDAANIGLSYKTQLR